MTHTYDAESRTDVREAASLICLSLITGNHRSLFFLRAFFRHSFLLSAMLGLRPLRKSFPNEFAHREIGGRSCGLAWRDAARKPRAEAGLAVKDRALIQSLSII